MGYANKKMLLLALIMSLFTTFLVYAYVKSIKTSSISAPQNIKLSEVYVATKTLPAKHKITEQDIKKTQVATEYLNSKAILNKEDIMGKRVSADIIEGEQIIKTRLTDDSGLTLSYGIPQGRRGVSININEQSEVSYLVNPGDYVDVIANFDKDETHERTVKTILQNIKVLAVGQNYDKKIDGKDIPKTVTLAVTPEESEKLVYISDYAIIRLALRPIDDNSVINSQGIVKNNLLPTH